MQTMCIIFIFYIRVQNFGHLEAIIKVPPKTGRSR